MRTACRRSIRAARTAALGIAAALAARAAWAEPIAYAGRIVDTAGNPLPWALVSVAGSPLSGQASADGSFSLAGEAPSGLPDRRPQARPAAGKAPGLRRSDGRSAPSVTSMLLWAPPPRTPDGAVSSPEPARAARLAAAWMMWDEGPGGGHYDNIAGDQKEAGCGIYVTPSGAVWVIQDFK